MLNRTLTFLLLVLSITLSGQSINIQKSLRSSDHLRQMHKVPAGIAPEDFFAAYQSEMQLSPSTEFVLKNESEGKRGFYHQRYEQYHKGIKVYGQIYILHNKDGQVITSNGGFAPNLDLETKAKISSDEALQSAMSDMGASEYSWQKTAPSFITEKKTSKPTAELVIIDKQLPENSGDFLLAYVLDVYASQPFSGYKYFVDARDGKIIKKINLIEGNGVPGQCSTRYYGNQEVTVDSLGPTQFMLYDETRGDEGQGVVNSDGSFYTNTSSEFGTDHEGYESGALDAHYCTSKFYDAMIEHFDWKGLDNNNKSMKIGVNAGDQEIFVNAFWDGEMAWIGAGDCNHGPLTTLEVVGHEFMHGILDYTSQLIYADESGAINESFADVMGTVLEFLEDEDNFSWELNSFVTNDALRGFRVMDDPNIKEHPAYYKGEYWEDGADVHTNSAIGNLVYVLLSDGRQGTNEVGDSYNITGIGKLEAAKFLFGVNKNYLTPSSNYNDYYNACLIAAEEYFPGNMSFLENLTDSWGYVGLPAEEPSNVELDLSLSSQEEYKFCFINETTELWFEINNTGGVDYTPDMLGLVNIDIGFDRIPFPLEDTIRVNESQRFTYDIFINQNIQVVFYELELPGDTNFSNDYIDDFIEASQSVENDLSIAFLIDQSECFKNENPVQFSIINESCDIIEAGKELRLKLVKPGSGEVLLEESLVTSERILPSSALSFERAIELNIGSTGVIEAELFFDEDPLTSNNTTEEFYVAREIVGYDYENTFDDITSLADGLAVESFFGLFDPGIHIQNYQGESVFYAGGIIDDWNFALCQEPKDNFAGTSDLFSGNFKLAATMSACVNLEGEDAATLNFDLIQFSNDNIANEVDFSSATMVSWGDGEDDYVIIEGQPEGISVPHSISLPADFKGELDFKFLALTGDFDFTTAYDAQLLDNLRFENTVATDELSENNFRIFPNPAQNTVQLISKKPISKIEIIDVQGRTIPYRSSDFSERTLDISELSQGHYIIHLMYGDGSTAHKRFVKVEP